MVLSSGRLIIIFLVTPVLMGLFLSPIFLPFPTIKADISQTSVIVHVCGNSVKEGDEFCDDGSNNGRYAYNAADRFCNSDCTGWAPYCGDGILQGGYDEECDDGNNNAGDGCSATCKTEAAAPPPGGGGGGVIPTVGTKVILKGKAYPGSDIHFLKDGKEIPSTKADSNADFTREITEITPGIYTFSIWAEDKDGIKSITYALTFRVIDNAITTVSGIFLPPTIGVDKTALKSGEILNIFGQTVPEVEVDVHILSSEIIKKVTSDSIGAWLLPFDTKPLEEGVHITKARFQLNGQEMSGFGKMLSFYIGEAAPPFPFEEVCSRADFNKDGRVNLVDFSIFLCWWGKTNPEVDLNNNGIVDLPDFSIFLCCWTG